MTFLVLLLPLLNLILPLNELICICTFFSLDARDAHPLTGLLVHSKFNHTEHT